MYERACVRLAEPCLLNNRGKVREGVPRAAGSPLESNQETQSLTYIETDVSIRLI